MGPITNHPHVREQVDLIGPRARNAELRNARVGRRRAPVHVVLTILASHDPRRPDRAAGIFFYRPGPRQ